MSSTFKVRLFAVSALLVGLALVQAPGFLVSDTKFDLAIDPAAFLSRALHLWNSQGTFGQLQNQAYGYLWPIGPFFVLGHVLGLPGWVVQRLWLALVLVIAFIGAARVAKALGVRSDVACLCAGVAFALSPRMLTTLGPISIEAWPGALAPWVLLPLIRGATLGSPRRAAAWSAFAVAMVGGVNAAATFAVIPMGAVWLLTRERGPRRRSMVLWWPVFVLLATLWWLVPLFLLGAYSPPFLDYIETTAITTFPTDLFDLLRGTSNWVPYVDGASRAGHDLLVTPYLIIDSAALVFLGIVGMSAKDFAHRRFLAFSLLVGVLMVGAGHRGPVEGWFAGDVRTLLDGALAPLRNVHKFDPIIRLPLVIGLAVAVDRALSRARSGSTRLSQVAVVGTALIALLGSVEPAVAERITPAGPTAAIPEYWKQAARWLESEGGAEQAMLIPGAPFGDYQWGTPRDEPLQSLAGSPWAVRDVIPLTPVGTIRMMDAIEERLAQGEGSAGLVSYLQRAGIRYLVVRNDLKRSDDVPDPVLVHQALSSSPGVRRAAAFGPLVGGGAELHQDGRRVVVNGGWQATYPAVEIYEVPAPVHDAVSSGTPTTVVGGPEDLMDLLDLNVIDDTPTVLGVDTTGIPQGRVVLTDGLRARERQFSRIHDATSPVLTPGDSARTGNKSRDYRFEKSDRWSTTAELDGASAISASSSLSDAGVIGGSRLANLPYAAVDGAADTEWISGSGEQPAWWEVRFDVPRQVSEVTLVGGESAADDQTVRVRGADGASEAIRLGPGDERRVELPSRETSWLRVEDASGASGRSLAIAEVTVPGWQVTRRLALPQTPETWGNPDAVVLRAENDARQGCAAVAGDVRCMAGRARAGEESRAMGRVVTLPQANTWNASLLVRPREGDELDRLALHDSFVDVSASSQAVSDPRSSARAAVDGDLSTSWVSSPDDLRPTLQLKWLAPQTLSSLQLTLVEGTPAQRPTELLLTWPGGRQQVDLDEDGEARFPAIRTDNLSIHMLAGDGAASLGFDGTATALGYGITELRLGPGGLLPVRYSTTPVRERCGSGPDMIVNGSTYRTRVVASPAAIASGEVVPAEVCPSDADPSAEIPLQVGRNTIDLPSSEAYSPESLVLTPTGTPPAPPSATVGSDVTGSGSVRRMTPAPGSALAVFRQNVNPGWQARQSGESLASVTVDGWQQAFALRNDARVVATFAPDARYRAGLGIGLAVGVVFLLAVLFTLRRRSQSALPPLAERTGGLVASSLVAVAAAGLLAGWLGLVVGLLALTAQLTVRRSRPAVQDAYAWVVAAPCLLTGGVFALRPWGRLAPWAGESGWLPYLLLVPLVTVVVASSAVLPRNRRGGRVLRASRGRSTNR